MNYEGSIRKKQSRIKIKGLFPPELQTASALHHRGCPHLREAGNSIEYLIKDP